MKPGLNPGIQGLRGIAILLVLLNHAGIPGFAGGYVGVDIFFVISGYLIGGLLWREGLRTGRIAIWEFYARRIRRLFPANAVLLLASAAASLLLLAPEEWGEVFSAMRAALLYVINLWFTGRATDYFAGHGAASPFLHLWSLAVEEQFYLVWPWLVVLCLRGPAPHFTRRLGWVTLTVAAASLLACVAATWWSQPLAFFNMPFRMWEFAAGIALAIGGRQMHPRQRAVLGWVSAGALVLMTLLMDERRQFPGLWAVLPVLCALGLLVVATQPDERGLLQRALGCRPLVWLGNCSYSVYLWHWPVLIFSAVIWPQPGAAGRALLVLASVAAGWVSWRCIEEPFRLRWLPGWPPARFVALTLVLTAGLAWATGLHRHGGSDAAQRDIAQQRQQRPASVEAGCHARFEAVDLPDCVFGAQDGARTVVLWGDSHAVNWFPAFERLARERGWRLMALTKSGCPSLDMPVWSDVLRREYTECAQWRDAMLNRIVRARPDLVVLANLSTGVGGADAWERGLARMLSRLAAERLDVAVMRDTPRVPRDVPTCAARAQWRGRDINEACQFPAADRRPWHDDVAGAQAAALARHPQVLRIDLSDAFCTGAVCPVADGGRLRFYDDNHLTPAFAASLSERLASRMLDAATSAGNPAVAGLLQQRQAAPVAEQAASGLPR